MTSPGLVNELNFTMDRQQDENDDTYAKLSPVFQMIPTIVRCEDTSHVVLAFDDDVPDNIQVILTIGQQTTNVKTMKLNSKTVYFLAPSCRDGTVARVTVRFGNLILSTDTMSLFYASGFTHEVMQFGHRLLDVLCSLVSRQSMTSRESLDVLLTDALFADDDAEQLPAIAFESLFGSVKHIATDEMSLEVPTLLHLAAKHGFSQLTDKLIDLPDSHYALSLKNVHGHCPCQMAALHGNQNMTNLLEVKAEVAKETFQEDENAYMRMDGHHLQSECSGASEVSTANGSGNSDNGLPSHSEEDDELPPPPPLIQLSRMRTSAGPELPPRRKVSLPHLNTNLPANAFGRRPSLPYGDNQPSSSFSPSNLLPLPQDCALHPLTSPKVLSRPPAALPDESTSTDRHSRVGRTASFDSGRGSIVSCGSLESEASNGVFSPVRLKKCEGSLTAEDGCYPEKTFISPTEPSPGCSARSRPLPAIPPVAKSSAHPPPPPPPVKRKPSVPVPPV